MLYLKASWKKLKLQFRFLAKTSRDELNTKSVYFLKLQDQNGRKGIGECSFIPGLSLEQSNDYENHLNDLCKKPQEFISEPDLLTTLPSLRFGLESALKDLDTKGNITYFDNCFSRGEQGIPINGLVWMGSKREMFDRVRTKINEGYKCVKLKIGGIDWSDELEILKYIRSHYSKEDIQIRVDANGAFERKNVHSRLEALSKLNIHSIEQPIKVGQFELLQELCLNSEIPIALDEELIALTDKKSRKELLEVVKPQYLVLKPSLLGGWKSCEDWIDLAESAGADFWITSALESNVGLSAIAQWTAELKPGHIYQGLGTGQLYSNNLPSPLYIENGKLFSDPNRAWDLTLIS